MQINREDYRKKLLGCWMGKNIGGTLGAPMEWERHFNDVSFYTQELGGEPLANDDLDLQLMWLVALEDRGVEVDAHTLAEYWNIYNTVHWAEYGVSKANMRRGLPPPLSGSFENWNKHSCGCFIRSEIWACIAPARPELAARYAYEDGIIDHGDGEGTYAEVFFAALESAAFVMTDLRELINLGLSYIPKKCGVAEAVNTAIASVDAGEDWKVGRDEILRKHRGEAHLIDKIGQYDIDQGFVSGLRGYDVPSNVAITVLGLLHGGEDFDRMICTTVNCGEDTDCTAATAGSIYGLMYGSDAIPEKWMEPIGHGIKTQCIHDSLLGKLPATIEELSRRTEVLADQVTWRYSRKQPVISEAETDVSDVTPDQLKSADNGADLYKHIGGPVFRFEFFTVYLDYASDPLIRSGEEKTITVTVYNTHHVQAELWLQWHLPDGWHISPSDSGEALSIPTGRSVNPLKFSFTFTADHVREAINRCVLVIDMNCRPGVMLVPLTLLNGDIRSLED